MGLKLKVKEGRDGLHIDIILHELGGQLQLTQQCQSCADPKTRCHSSSMLCYPAIGPDETRKKHRFYHVAWRRKSP